MASKVRPLRLYRREISRATRRVLRAEPSPPRTFDSDESVRVVAPPKVAASSLLRPERDLLGTSRRLATREDLDDVDEDE